MRWLLGADLGTHDKGAMEAALWLAGSATEHSCGAVHVFEPARLSLLHSVTTAMAVEEARRELVNAAFRLGASNTFGHLDVVVADSVEDGLSHRAVTGGYDALLLGRAAPQSSDAVRRLGAVARRLLRRLPVAVAVVPPDVKAIGTGRIVLGTDLTASSAAAGRFASKLANELRRELVVIHVHEWAWRSPIFGAGGRIDLPSESRPASTGKDVARWVEAQGFRSVSSWNAEGPVADALNAFAREEDAPALVVGSRMLSLGDRVFTTSVGTNLAGLADRMVVVVPSTQPTENER
jgi:nucleotide-binding universal stress UspA family protein